MEEFNLLRSPAGTAYGDYAFRLCLTRDGFKAIPETLNQRGPADDCDGGGATTKMLVLQADWTYSKVLPWKTRKQSSSNNNNFNSHDHHNQQESGGPGHESGPAQNKWPRGLVRGDTEEEGIPQARGKKSNFIPSSKTNQGSSNTNNRIIRNTSSNFNKGSNQQQSNVKSTRDIKNTRNFNDTSISSIPNSKKKF